MKLRASMSAVTAVLLLTAGSAFATTVTINPNKDNTLCQTSDGSLSNATGDIFSGRTNQTDTSSRRRGVISFDVAGNVPAGATISSAKLDLYLNKTGDTSARTYNIYKISASWGEGTSFFDGGQCATSTTNDATWIHRFYNTTNWTSSGGDFSGTSSASLSVGTTTGQYYEWGSTSTMVSDAQGWLTSASTNYGWLLKGDESTAMTARRFTSREGTSTQVPKLILVYTTGGLSPRFFWARASEGKDVTGDGIADTIWHNLKTGELRLESKDGTAVALGSIPVSGVTQGVHDLGGGPALVVEDGETGDVLAVPIGKATASPIRLVDGSFGLRLVRFADFDGDGKEDLVVRDDAAEELYVAGWDAAKTKLLFKSVLTPSGVDPDGI